MKKTFWMLKNQIAKVKYNYDDIPVRVVILNNEIFVTINSLKLSNDPSYELMVYEFMKEYDRLCIFNIYWGVDNSFFNDDLSLIEEYAETLDRSTVIIDAESSLSTILFDEQKSDDYFNDTSPIEEMDLDISGPLHRAKSIGYNIYSAKDFYQQAA